MNDMVKAIRESLGPAGDLYLSKTKAEHLLRWLEISDQAFLEYQKSMLIVMEAVEVIKLLDRGNDEKVTNAISELVRSFSRPRG